MRKDDFKKYLIEEKKLKINTCRNYCSAINRIGKEMEHEDVWTASPVFFEKLYQHTRNPSIEKYRKIAELYSRAGYYAITYMREMLITEEKPVEVLSIRLNKILRELNISLDRAVEFLASKGIEIEERPTSKITESVANMLRDEYTKIEDSVEETPLVTQDDIIAANLAAWKKENAPRLEKEKAKKVKKVTAKSYTIQELDKISIKFFKAEIKFMRSVRFYFGEDLNDIQTTATKIFDGGDSLIKTAEIRAVLKARNHVHHDVTLQLKTEKEVAEVEMGLASMNIIIAKIKRKKAIDQQI